MNDKQVPTDATVIIIMDKQSQIHKEKCSWTYHVSVDNHL